VADNFEKFSDPDTKQASTDGMGKSGRNSNLSLVAVCRIVAIVLAGVLSGYLAHEVHRIEVNEKEQNQLQELSQQRAELTAQNVEFYVQNIERSVAQFTGKPQLSAAIENNNITALLEFEKVLKSQLAHIEAVRFFRIGEAQHDAKTFPPIRFAELELIRFAENRQPTQPEALILQDKRLLTFVSPIPSEPGIPVVGSMMVSLSVEGVTKALELNNIGMGNIVLAQHFGKGSGSAQTVAQYSVNAVGEAKLAPVANSPWIVKFSPSYRLSEQAEVNIPFILTGLVLFSLALIVFSLWLGSRIGERLQSVLDRGNTKNTWQTITAVATGAEPTVEAKDGRARKADILDVAVADEDETLLGLQEREREASKRRIETPDDSEGSNEDGIPDIPEFVFRAYDIRGPYGKGGIDENFAMLLGQALGSEALDAGDDTLIVARDARTHSPTLTEYLIRGILNSGCHVLNLGTVPTPLLYFATETLDAGSSGVMVTASHNAASQNGFKIVMGGKCRSEQDIKAVRSRILANNVYQGKGEESRFDIVPGYIDAIFSDVALAGDVSIVVDAANAVPGIVAPKLFEELGCQVTPLYCDLDGSFPNHEPDPTIEKNLIALVEKVKEVKADLGVALDGDGDRIVVVTSSGKIIWPDRLLMLFAKDIVSRNPGADVVFDVKSTRHLNNCITEVGGRPIMWKTGHSPMKAKMRETGALVGGEYSGHIFIKDRWYGFDDGLYAAARLIEIMSLQGESLDQMFKEFPESPHTPEIRVDVPEEKKFDIVRQLIESGEFGSGKVTTLDGIRVDYSNGWGLVRASNTSAHLTLRFEADDDNALHQLKSLFVKQLRAVDSTLNVDWKKYT